MRGRTLLTTISAVGLLLAACGDERDAGGIATTTQPAVTTAGGGAPTPSGATEVPTTAAAPEPAQVDATLSEYKIDMPAEIPSGFVRVSATNTGTLTHHLILGRIHDGSTFEQLIQTFATDQMAAEGMIDFYGGPNGVDPGTTVSADLNLLPGNYIAICVIPGADGVPHAAMGMFAPVTVTDGGAVADLSALDVEATITLSEYDFTITPGFDGKGRVLVTNNGSQAHEVAVSRIGEGGSLDEFKSTLIADPATLDPAVAARYTESGGGITPIAPGMSAIVEFDLAEGDYAFICFVTDTGDMLPHFLHNMVKLVHIPT
jgi:hypothetical protein